ncbi:DUF4184 family protein [Streptacidiphilus rugosus]|uniref:DUF4184 family protein n=1 Tax=Streptacidiphilus rugosus TaxID=405783 RepID=UPI00068DD169|nr:DUF4184 family protein [Streptacidiphilus rugosus]
MPFTLSHPAAVLPFLRAGRPRGRLIASALVAGSLAPDVPYFLDSVLPGTYGIGRLTHRPWAVATLDAAVAAGLVGAWHGLLREPLTALLPQPLADRVAVLTKPTRRTVTPADAAWFVASAGVGAFTHVAWDAFTHHGRFGERHWPALGHPINGRMPVYQALQWASSVAGLAALVRAGERTLRATKPEEPVVTAAPAARTLGLTVLASATAVGAIHRARRDAAHRGAGPLRGNDLVAAVSFGGGAGAALGAAGWALSALAGGRASNMTDREPEPAPQRR